MTHSVRIPWRDTEEYISAWNDICIWAIETFGLPGVKFVWHPHDDYMDFVFEDERDATLFLLRWA